MYWTKDISGSIDVSNHHSTHVLTYLARMARLYNEWLCDSKNSIPRDWAHPIAPIQTDFQSYGQGLQNILIVISYKDINPIEGGITQNSVIPPSFVCHSSQEQS